MTLLLTISLLLSINFFPSGTHCINSYKSIPLSRSQHSPGSISIDTELIDEAVDHGDEFEAIIVCDSINNLVVKSDSSDLIDVDIDYVDGEYFVTFINNGLAGEYETILETIDNNVHTDILSFYIYSDGVHDCGSFNCIEEARETYFLNYSASFDELVLLGLEEEPSGFSTDEVIYDVYQTILDFVFDDYCISVQYSCVSNQNHNGRILLQGQIKWLDSNNNLRPLIDNQILFFDRDVISLNDYCGQTYTDDYGCFSLLISGSQIIEWGGLDLFFLLPAMTRSSYAILGTLAFQYLSTVIYNIEANSTITYQIVINPQQSVRSAAFEIPQAMNIGQNYVYAMENLLLPAIPILYPIRDCGSAFGTSLWNEHICCITIGREDYCWWDVLLHEYGHYVEMEFDFSNPTLNVKHCEDMDLCDEYGLEFGLQIAFTEGLATYLSIASQLYFANSYGDNPIPNAFDYSYNDPGFSQDFSVYYYPGGDGYERTVSAVLLQIIDDENGDNDYVSIGHHEMWLSLKDHDGEYQYLAELIETIVSRNPTEAGNIGLLLEAENLSFHASSNTSMLSTNASSSSWTFSWELNDTRGVMKSNLFNLVFVGNSNSYTISNINTTTYALTYTQKSTVLSLDGDIINWHLECITSEIDNYPIYRSSNNQLSKPLIPLTCNIAQSNTFGSNKNKWFKFIAPQTSTYHFESASSGFVSGELFPSMVLDGDTTGRLYQSLNNQGDFSFDYSLNQNQVVYLRVTNHGIINNITTLITNPHTHNHTDHYETWNTTSHKAFCSCGHMVYENHVAPSGMGVMIIGHQEICTKCGQLFTNPLF